MSLPKQYVECEWCGEPVRLNNGDRSIVVSCSSCGLPANETLAASLNTSKPSQSSKPAVKQARESRFRNQRLRETDFNNNVSGKIMFGVDPGARYTGVAVRDNDKVLYSGTITRPKEVPIGEWMPTLLDELQKLMDQYSEGAEVFRVAVEGVSAPKGFKHGQRASLNPEHIMLAAAVFGSVVGRWGSEVIIIPPGGNGSQHLSQYPPELVNRRKRNDNVEEKPAGTRGHERSAYDVAGKGQQTLGWN